MKKALALTILLLLPAFPAKAQDGPSPDSKLHRDFPQTQLIRPTYPLLRYNFNTGTWEPDKSFEQRIDAALITKLDALAKEMNRLRARLKAPNDLPSHRRHRKRHLRRRAHRNFH